MVGGFGDKKQYMYLSSDQTEEILNKVIELFILPRFQELGMRATGEWEQNLSAEATGLNSGSIIGRQYTEQLVNGREPGKLPPISALEKWVTAKFGLTGKEATSMAWAVAKKIAKQGTSWYEKGGSNLMEVLEEPRTLQYIQEEVGGKFRLKIQEELIRNAEEIFR